MGRMHDALKKAEEERRKKREAESAAAPAPDPAPAAPAPTPSPAPVNKPHAREEKPARSETTPRTETKELPRQRVDMTARIKLPEPESKPAKKGIAAGLGRAHQEWKETPAGRRFGELLLTLHAPADQRSEQIRAIRTNILSLKNVPQVLALTSAVADEGAGLTAANLAVCFAEDRSQKVLLVDADLRGTRLRGFFDVEKETPGFTEILEGSLDPRKAIVESGVPNLYLVAAGREVSNPGGLLSSHSLDSMIEAWRGQFDRIILVLPPVNDASDAAIIGRRTDGALMVVKLGATPRRESEHAIEALSSSGVHLLGCVVTNAGPVREQPGRRN